MCGISGIIDFSGVDSAELHKMSAVLKHRGPDDEGYFISSLHGGSLFYKAEDTISELASLKHINSHQKQSDCTIGLMHRRLSIIDLSPGGHQPMIDEITEAVIVFNGEIYNYKEVRLELESLGHSFKNDSDTEVILKAYAQWEEKCVNRFVGMWAFAIYDPKKFRLFLSRDRFGIKPLYYSFSNNKFAFASEIKALLQLEMVKPDVKPDTVLEYISFGATSNPNDNLFKNIFTLPPSHHMMVNVKTLEQQVQKYYYLEKAVNDYQFQSKDIISSYRKLLDDAIQLHLRSDVPIGSALSGGLDSSSIVAIAAEKMNGNKFKTFTASYAQKDIDESYYAKLVSSAHPNIEAFYAYPNIEDYWKELDTLIWHQDMPINSTSMFAQWTVMKTAKQQNIKVLLDGQGADECLGGYYNFAGIHLIELFKKGKLFSFNSERKALKENFTKNIDNAIARAGYYFLPDYVQRSLRSKNRIGMGMISGKYADQLSEISVPQRGGKSFRELSISSMNYSMQDLLRYEDRNSMAFSIESRVPFLDHRLVEFSIALENEWKIKGGWTKYVLRKSCESILNKEVVWRKDKMGFLTPQKEWKENSKRQLKQFINDTEIPDFLNKQRIIAACESELNDNSHLSEFWKLVSFVKWANVYKVNFK